VRSHPNRVGEQHDGRVPGLAHTFAFALGQLGQQVAHAVHGAVLAVRGGPALLDRFDQPGGTVGEDQHRRPEPAGDQVAPQRQPVLVGFAHPQHHRQEHPLALIGESQATSTPSLGPLRADREKDRIEKHAAKWTSYETRH
jgi:hypothetical protein